MKVEKNVMIEMKDGIKLATDLYIPQIENETSFPALINRTPYNKDNMEASKEVKAFVKAGYVVVIQDVRGRYHSEGNFVPYEYEIFDGLELFKWVIQQSWCNGHFGTFGGSYNGGTQYLPATKNPEGLAAMIPVVTFDDLYNGSAYNDGAKVLHDLRWTVVSIIPDIMERARKAGEEVKVEPPEVYNCLEKIPLASDEAVKIYGKYYLNWMKHSTFDDYWKKMSIKEHYNNIMVPTLNISGWYDIFVPSTLNNYMGMKEKGGSEIARANAYLIMGPWSHINFSGKMNEFDFGSEASEDAIDLLGIQIAWYDFWLKNKPIKYLLNKHVKIFVMGENKWREEDDWPLPNTNYISYYFHSEGNANIKNGLLSIEKPAEENSDKFTFDPLNPVPTVGGQVILPGEGAIGPRDQTKVEERDDVLVYETDILKDDITIIGPLTTKLFISSDCKDTDFTAKLTDVDENNVSKLLSDGILRMRYRNSLEKTELIEPGKIYEININVGATANTFLKGHKIRVSISSCNFPRFNRNSNSGGDIMFEEVSSYQKANNVVLHDSSHPSCIILPIINK